MRHLLKALVISLLLSLPAHGMNRLVEILATGVTNDVGAPLAAGTATFYDAGTTNLRTVYTDFNLSTPASNPLTLDSAGRAVVYSDRRIKVLLKTSAGATVRTVDNVGTADSDVAAAAADASAGNGLIAPGDGTVAVNPDAESVEVFDDKVRVKAGGISQGSSEILNGTCAASVASSALTIALKNKGGSDPTSTSPVTIPFRSATITSGAYTTVQVTSALSTVASSGSTAGHVSAVEWPLYVYLLNNAGTAELAWSTSPVDERYLQSTTAEGGAGAADSAATLYSTTARSNVPVKLLCVMKSTQTTAGTWAAVPTAISSASSSNEFSQIYNRATGTTVPVGGVALSTSSGSFSRAASSNFGDVISATVTVTGKRPVMVAINPDGTSGTTGTFANYSGFKQTSLELGAIRFLRDATIISQSFMSTPNSAGESTVGIWYVLDFPPAGTYTYKLQIGSNGSQTVWAYNLRLVAFEL